MAFPTLPDNLDLLPRRDLVALCEAADLRVRANEKAADLRERLLNAQRDEARRERDRVRYLRDEAYRKRVPAPRSNPAVDAVCAGLWGLANLAGVLERHNVVASAVHAALPTLDAYINGGDVTPEEARLVVRSLEEALRLHEARVDEAPGRIEWHLADVSRLQQKHAAAEQARRADQYAARKADPAA